MASTLLEIDNRVSQRERERERERAQRRSNLPLPQSNFLRTIDFLLFKQKVYYSLTAIYTPQKYLQGNLISHDKSNVRS